MLYLAERKEKRRCSRYIEMHETNTPKLSSVWSKVNNDINGMTCIREPTVMLFFRN